MSEIIRPEIRKETYNKIVILAGVDVRSGLETALQQILKKEARKSKIKESGSK